MARTYRNASTQLALLAGLALGGSALAQQQVLVVGPASGGISVVDTTVEKAGPRLANLVLRANAAVGDLPNFTRTGANNLTRVGFRPFNGTTPVGTGFESTSNVVCPQIGTDVSAPGGNFDVTINFSQDPGFPSFMANALAQGADRFQIILSTGGVGTALNSGVGTIVNASEATDTSPAIDIKGPSIVNAYRTAAATTVYLIFDEEVTTTGANTADIQLDADGNFAAGAVNPDALGAITSLAADSARRTLSIAEGGLATPAPANLTSFFVRVAALADGSPDLSVNVGNIVDTAGNPAYQKAGTGNDTFGAYTGIGTGAGQGIQITNTPALQITGVRWVTEVNDEGGNQNDALEFVYNQPLQTIGDTTFYLRGSTALSRVVAGVPSVSDYAESFQGETQVPTDSTRVRVTVAGGDGTDNEDVFADGAGPNGETYTYLTPTTTSGGTLPTSALGGTAYAITSGTTVPVGDGIAPSNPVYAYFDTRGATPGSAPDGKVDRVGLVFPEPLAATTAVQGDFTGTTIVAAVNPVTSIDADGNLVSVNTAAATNVPFTGFGSNGSAKFNFAANRPARLDQNNVIFLDFDPNAVDWDGAGGVAAGAVGNAFPGTGGPAFMTLAIGNSNRTATDAGGNAFTLATAATNVGGDRAAPVAFDIAFNSNEANTNDLVEAGIGNVANVGDAASNNNLQFIVTENLASTATTNGQLNNIFYAPGVTLSTGNTGGQAFANNTTTFTANGNTNPVFAPGTAQVTVQPGSNIKDATGNELVIATPDDITDYTAPYIPLVTDVNNSAIHSAFLVDDDTAVGQAGFGFADRIQLRFTKAIAPASVQLVDFSLSTGTTITTAAVSGTDATLVELTFADGAIPMANTVTVTYRAGATRISDTATPARRVRSNTAQTVIARGVSQPTTDTDNVALMTITGTLTSDGTAAAPRGSKVWSMIAVPAVTGITFNYNGNDFTMNFNAFQDSSTPGNVSASLNAFTNWLLGVEPHVYLTTDGGNRPFFTNTGAVGDTEVKVTASNLAAATFTGTLNNSTQTRSVVTNGRLTINWDVLRSSAGTTYDFFTNGYAIGGRPVLSRAVVDGATGAYNLTVSAPIQAFGADGRLNSIDRPLIIVAELPNGQRYATSSLLSSINGAPVLFRANNRTQQAAPNAGQAFGPATHNINLARIGSKLVRTGWNLVAFDRVGGWARGAGTLPTLANGVTAADITGSGTPSTNTFVNLVATDARDQFVYWNEANADGIWNSQDDANAGSLDSIIIDAGQISQYAFTLTNRGVQLGTALDSIVGGYGIGLFNANANAFGFNLFGAALSQNAIFPTTGTGTYPNNATNSGWVLAAVTAPAPQNTVANFFTNNGARVDNALWLDRTATGFQAYNIQAPAVDTQNIGSLPVGSAWFVHFRP